MGWPWKMAIRMDDALKKNQQKDDTKEKGDTDISSENIQKTVEAAEEEDKKN